MYSDRSPRADRHRRLAHFRGACPPAQSLLAPIAQLAYGTSVLSRAKPLSDKLQIRVSKPRESPPPMLIYHPPKSQVWGHRVGRLKTMQLFDRSERFVQEQMLVQPPQTADFTVNWMPVRAPEISSSIESFRDSINSHPRRLDDSIQFRLNQPLPDDQGLSEKNRTRRPVRQAPAPRSDKSVETSPRASPPISLTIFYKFPLQQC
jgi:hypothetical protein